MKPSGQRTSTLRGEPIRRRFVVAAVATLLAVHVWLAFRGVIDRSVTADETAHITAGYVYWKFADYRLQPENGNLPQRWATLPLLPQRPMIDPAQQMDDWAVSRVWNVAQHFLFESGNNTDFLVLCARSAMLFWSVAAGLLIFWWARRLWGNRAGIGALAFFSISPTTLAHGPLVTSDMCGAVCLLATAAVWWWMCDSFTAPRVAAAGLVSGVALVAKFSAVLLIPTFIALSAIRVATRAAGSGPSKAKLIGRAFTAFGGAALVALGVLWCFYGYRYQAPNVAVAPFLTFYFPWEKALSTGQLWTKAVRFLREVHFLPEAYLYGFSFVTVFSSQRGSFLVGNYSVTGWWWFFPFAFLVKSTIGELLGTALLGWRGLPLLGRLKHVSWRPTLASWAVPLLVFGLIYSAVSLNSRLNIGQRHILPLYLILFIFSGALFAAGSPKLIRMLAVAGIIFSATETLSVRFNHLAFFNRLAGGPSNGWKLLVDSSLDWGQDVSALAKWVQRNHKPDEPVYFSCFGTADPEYEGIKGEPLAPYYSLGKPRHWIELKPGLYCVSATMLQDVYGIQPGPWTARLERDFQYLSLTARVNFANRSWSTFIPETGFHPEHLLWLLDRLRFARLCQYLKVRKPDAVINYTQFVYRLSAEEIDTFSNRPYSALVSMMEKAMAQAR